MEEKYSFPSSLSDDAAQAADHLWAKFPDRVGGYYESIPLHTECACVILDILYDHLAGVLARDETFWKDLRVALLFHDMGKFVKNFQFENRKKIKGGRPNWEIYLRHEFISCLLLLSDASAFVRRNPDILFAVAGHHKPLTDGLFSEISNLHKPIDFEDEDMSIIENYLVDRLAKMGISWSFRGRPKQLLHKCRSVKDTQLARAYWNRTAFKGSLVQDSIMEYYTEEDCLKKRLNFALFQGLLHTADWNGSARQLPQASLKFGDSDLRKSISKKPGVQFKGWRKFQEQSQIDGHVLAIAPTGSGKTEASLLWAAQKPAGTRIFYCLPTKVTSNAIYERIKQVFEQPEDREKVAVVHSGAKFYRSLNEDDFRELSYLQDKCFGRQITVCTIDQLLTVNFNLGHWHMKTLHLQAASIIIDEVHLYEPYTLGLIISAIKYFNEHCGCRFYLMTATMPKKLKALLQQTLPSAIVIEDEEKLAQARNEWHYLDVEWADESLQLQIKKDIYAGKKVLIVRNTVDSCREAYEQLKGLADEDKRCCLHSRFTVLDRNKKEKQVVSLIEQQAFLLVSTQVVEVSLDIDFDVLYTENAPVDALIQRAGRVNRKGRKDRTRIVVFKASKTSEKMYEKQVDALLKRTATEISRLNGDRVSEAEMIDMTNRVYQDFDVEATAGYAKGLNAYAVVQQAHSFIYDVPYLEEVYIREGLDSVQIIPNNYFVDIQGKTLAQKSLYQIPVRKKQLARLSPCDKQDKDHSFLIYAGEDYNSETGLPIPNWQNLKDGKPAETKSF